ncbi:hypothetical protein BCR43DRAFT_495974 [Syncephalastrum racemosum]|uniref:DUF159-domain-containing protein n=1 Tax=Syncephalastrum racemosum TaxID=13706 RepID=A0A1X2H6T9_SYNRA|nr:hypothetical protein BCR43DRAFT_495974 [Syncephalastrum racemosum]
MCGRFACYHRVSDLQPILEESNLPTTGDWIDQDRFQPVYNVAPRRFVPVVRQMNGEYVLQSMKWGLIPAYAKSLPDNQPINARDDTLITGTSMFERAKNKGRCIVVADGFYEWKKLSNGKKIPYYTKRKDGKLMLFAGLYDTSHLEKDTTLYTCTIVTTSASSFFSFLHDRMPVILENGSDEITTWLSEGGWDMKKHAALLKPYEGKLDCYQVTDKVGPTGTNSPDFIVPVDKLKGSISNFFQKVEKKRPREEEEEVVAATKKEANVDTKKQKTEDT